MRVGVLRAWLASPCAAVLCSASTALTFGQVDDFQDGTVQNWRVAELGAFHPAPPQNVGGGMLGSGDRYLLLTSIGGVGAGSRMVVFNTDQWAGNYTSTGVTRINMWAINLGNTDLFLRLVFENPSGGPPTDVAVTNDMTPLAPGSGWTLAGFDVDAASLTALLGTSENALSTATMVRIMSNPSPTFPPPAVVAQLGVDNIHAVPEPSSLVGLAALGLMALRRKR